MDLRTVMKAFWNEKASENALYYVSSYLPYDQQDPAEFWRWGDILADRYLGQSGIEFSGDETVLDLGCGVGRFLPTFAKRFKRVYGLDISQGMIDLARANLRDRGNVEFVVGSGTDLLCFSDDMFDFVFSYIMFQHLPDKTITTTYIRDAARVLKCGGYFYFQVNNAPPPGFRARLRLGSRARGAVLKLGRVFGTGPGSRQDSRARPGSNGLDHPAWVGSRMSLPELRAACAQAGLDIKSLSGEGTQYLWVKARKPT